MKILMFRYPAFLALFGFAFLLFTVLRWNASDLISSYNFVNIRNIEKGVQQATLKSSAEKFRWLETNKNRYDVNNSTDEIFLEHLVFSESKRLQISCPRQVRMGRQADGGWNVCVAAPFDIVRPCLVYSIGMGGEWSFDRMITSKYGCVDMAYDPTLGKPDHTPFPLLYFYNTGLGGKNEVNAKHWSLKTFATLLEQNNHTEATIDILKMDIEYSEWASLQTMLAEPRCLQRVKQLMIEFHTREVDGKTTSSASDLLTYWNIHRGIDALGFKLWHTWNNAVCNFKSKRIAKTVYCGCHNAYFINVNYLTPEQQ